MTRLNVGNIRHPDGTNDNISLDSSGRVLVGTSSVSSISTMVLIGRSDGATNGANLRIEGNYTPADGNSLGALLISQAGQSGQDASARIECRRDGGTWTSGSSMPGRLVFSTTADGSASPTEQMRLDSSGNLKFNSGYGSVATAYGCRAWVNFNGTGTVAKRADGNVSSITDLDTGKYRVNFSNSMPDTNYCVIGSVIGSQSSSNAFTNSFVTTNENGTNIANGYVEVRVLHTTSGAQDHSQVNVAVFR